MSDQLLARPGSSDTFYNELDSIMSRKAAPEPPPKRGIAEDIATHLAVGANKYLALPVAGITEMAGKATGIKPLENAGKAFGDNAESWIAQKEQEDPSQKFRDISGVGDAARWAGEQILEFAPQAVIGLATGGAGAAAGRVAAGGLARAGITSIEGMAGKKAVQAAVANTGRSLTAKELGILAADRAGIAGAIAATGAGSVAMESSTIYRDQKPEEKDMGRALLFGTAAGILDTAFPAYLMKKTGLTKIMPGMGKVSGEAEVLTGKTALTGIQRVKDTVKVAGLGIGEETVQEGVQTVLENIGSNKQVYSDEVNKAGGNFSAFLKVAAEKGISAAVHPEAWNDIIESMAAGGLIGGVMGGGSSAAGHVSDVIQQRGQQQQTPTEEANALNQQNQPATEIVSGANARTGNILQDSSSIASDSIPESWPVDSGRDLGIATTPPAGAMTRAVNSILPDLPPISADMYSSFAAQPFANAPEAQPDTAVLPSPPSEIEKALTWRKQQTSGHLMQLHGERDASYSSRILSEYRKSQEPALSGAEGKANGITNILPEVQREGTLQVDRSQVALPVVQGGVGGDGSNNIQSGGVSNDLSSVQQKINGPQKEVSGVRGQTVADRVSALKQEKDQLLTKNSNKGITGGLVYPAEVTQRLGEINAEIKKATEIPDAIPESKGDSVFSGTMAADYLLTGGSGVMLSTEYLLQAYSGLFQKSSAAVEQIRKKYAQEIADNGLQDIKNFVNSTLYGKILSEIKGVVSGAHNNNPAIDDIFNELSKYPTGMPPKVGNLISQKIDALEQNTEVTPTTAEQDASVKKVPAATPVTKPANTRRQLDTTKDSLAVAVAKLGGVSRAEIDKQSGNGKDLAHTLNTLATKEAKAGILHVISSKGIPLDRMRESLVEQGYLDESADINTLLDKLDSASRGTVHRSTHSTEAGADAYREAEIRYSEMINAMTDEEYDDFSRNQWLDEQVQELADVDDILNKYLDGLDNETMTAADWQEVENDLKEALDATEFSQGNSTEDQGQVQEDATSKAKGVSPVGEDVAASEGTASATGVSDTAKTRLKQAHEKFKAKQSETTLGQKYAKRFNNVLALAKAKHEAYKTKIAAHQTRKRVAEANVFTALTNHAEVGKLAAVLDVAGFNEQAEMYVTDYIQKLIDAAETPQEMLAYSELLVDGKSVLPENFFISLKKDAAKAFAQTEKDKNRDPEVYRSALENSQMAAGILPDISLEDARQFKEGFDHALKGKTKSTLPGEGQYAAGYKAAQGWMQTDTGKAWFEGKRLTKEKSTGDSLRRGWDKQKKDLDSIDGSDTGKAWQRILKATARADHFPILLADDATPGAKAWLENFRSKISTFADFFTWEAVNSEQSTRRRSFSTAEAAFNGKWVSDRGIMLGIARDDKTSRLEVAKQIAIDYQSKIQELAKQFDGIKDLAGIEKVTKDIFPVENNPLVYGSDAYKSNRALYLDNRSISRILPSDDKYGSWQYDLQAESRERGTARRDSLVRPRLDKIVRKGVKDVRNGKDISADQLKKSFGFADITIGQYVTAQQAQDHINYTYDALMTLTDLLKCQPKDLSFSGRLHYAIGALGHGKYAAHFSPNQTHPKGGTVPVINVTNTKGDGAFLHEFFHAIDWLTTDTRLKDVIKSVKSLLVDVPYTAEQVLKDVEGFLEGRRNFTRMPRNSTPKDHALYLLQNYYDRSGKSGRQTDFYREAVNLDAGRGNDPYWSNSAEPFARMAEAWGFDALKDQESRDDYLVSDWCADGKTIPPQYKGTPYPRSEERGRLTKMFGELVNSIEWTTAGPVLKKDHKWQEILPYEDVSAPFQQARKEALAKIDDIAKNLKERKAEEAAEKQRKKDEAVWGTTPAEDSTPVVKPPSEVIASDDAAVGTSVDELEAIFDEVADSLDVAAQEPDTEAPGAKLFEHQTETDVAVSAEPNTKIERKPLPKSGEYGPEGSRVRSAMYDEYELYDIDKPTPSDVRDFNKLLNDQYYTGWGNWTQPSVEYRQHQELANKAYNAGLADGAVTEKADKKKQQSKTGSKGDQSQAVLDKTTADLAKEFAKHGVKGIDEALKGLASIFGGGQGRIMSYPSGFDEESYKKAKPHFESAAVAFQQAGMSFKEFIATFFRSIIQTFGRGVKPYAIQFAKEYEESYNQLQSEQAIPAATTKEVVVSDNAPGMLLSLWVKDQLDASTNITWQELFKKADEYYGGTQAEGVYSVKDAYDAVELGINQALVEDPHYKVMSGLMNIDAAKAVRISDQLQLEYLEKIPTQTKRTTEMDEFQQFSTPPHFAWLANWAANLRKDDTYLEPSAGIGGMATFAKMAGVKEIVVNELSARRLALLQMLPFDRFFSENAEQLDNILPDDVQPTVIVMNPPFSSTAGRVQGQRDTMNGGKHIEQALSRLVPGGRLVAIVGEGMASTKPAFRDWWKKIEANYSVRANIGIEATSWAKYGTTFDNQILVIDKVAPTGAEIVTGKVSHPNEAFALLEGIRNERPIAETAGTRGSVADQSGSGTAVQSGGSNQNGVAATSGTGSPVVGSGGSGTKVQSGTGQSPESLGGTTVHDGSQSGSGSGTTISTGSGPGGRVTGNTTQLTSDQTGNSTVNDSVRKSGSSELSDKLNDALGSEVELKADDNSEQGEINNSQFEQYTPKKVRIGGSIPHNTPLVESAALAAVTSPDPTYTPNLPKNVITKGLLSDAQLEAVVYAGQAHEQWLVNGQRRGFFLGDGTGVGKGRQISGIILDNMRQGQKKAVWISKKSPLIEDAKRDFSDIGGDAKLIFQQDKTKSGEAIPVKEGILFAGYKLLQSGSKAAKQAVKTAGNRTKDANGISYERTQQIANWLGKGFDGVIVFDESHEMGNAIATKGARGGKKPSNQALAALELQRALPKAKIVYVSATGATEVSNLAYAERLGLWGEGTPFQDVNVFIDNMSKSVSAMELVAQNLKQMGLYLARSLSFDGIVYNKIEHELTDYQRETYDLLAGGWQKVLQNINGALEKIGVTDPDGKGTGKNSKDIKSAIMSQFWGSHQRFFNQIITAGAMPTVLEQIEQDLKDGKSVVLQLVNTNEAGQERALARAAGKKLEEGDDSVAEELDLTPREQLIEFIKKYFPTVQQEEYTDGYTEAGKPIIKLRPVVDSKGNLVENKEAVAMREELIVNINSIRIPDSAMQMLFNHFGPEQVAEITGRTQRVIYDEKGKMQIQKRGPAAVASDSTNFKDGKKRILIFSQAGGTGFSFHADRRYKNQEQRVHYILQPGWSADKAIQGLGRSHRTNQSSTPIYRLVTTDIPAQKRFISSIARRLEQLGALTSGQRDTAGGALFSATDNLESVYSTRAVQQFFGNAFGVSRRTGYDALPADLLEQMGLSGIIDKDTNQIAEDKIPQVTQFLNRLMSLRIDTQGKVFDLFLAELEQQIEVAKQMGSFDDGMQTIRHVGAEVNQEEEVYRDPMTNAPTKYLAIEYKTPNPIYDFDETNQFIQSRKKVSQKAGWFKNIRSHRIAGIYATTGTRTDKNGNIQSVFGVWRTSGNSFETEGALGEIGATWSRLSDEEARAIWEKENSDRPRTSGHKLNMVVGGVLPIWNRFNNESIKVVRIGTDDGRRFLGRQIDQKDLAETMKKLNVASPAAKMTGAELAKQIVAGNQVEMSNGWKFKRVKVSNDTRIEVLPKGYAGRGTEDTMIRAGVVFEKIQYNQRYFVPTGEKAGAVIDSLMKSLGMNAIEIGNNGPEASFKLTDTQSTGIQATEAQAWVSTLPIAKRVNVVQSISDLPENAQSEITKAQVNPAHVQAMELHGTIHVITDNVPDLRRVKALVIGHELAHAGQSEKIVDLAVDWFKRTVNGKTEQAQAAHATLERVASVYGYDLAVETEYRKAVKEATAAIAEQAADENWQPTGLALRLFMYIKHWLRQNGLISHVSDSELSMAVAEMLRIGEKRLSIGKGENTANLSITDQEIASHAAKINAPAKVTDMVKSLIEMAGQSIPERLKANIGKILSNPWFGSEGKPIRRHVVNLNLERSQNRNGIISDLFQASEGYTGVEGLDNILKKASKEELKQFNDLIKHGDENGVATYFTRDELYRGKTKFGKVGKTVVEAYRAFHEVMNAANRVRFQQLDELSMLPYKDQEWFADLVELLNKNMERAAALDAKEASEVHRLIRSLKRNLTDEELASGENPAKIKASPAVIAAYRDFWKQVDQTEKKHQGNMLSAFRDILGYRGELDKLKSEWGNLGGYAPRNRKDGDWHVSVYTTNEEGERVKVYMKPTLTETGAKGLVKEVQADLKKHLKGNFEAGTKYEVEYERNNATPSELLAWKGSEVAVEALLNQAFDRAGVTGKMSVEQWQSLKHEVFQEIAKEIMAQGFGRHGISREANMIEGYDDADYQTVLKEYISGMSGWLSKMRFAIEATNAAKDISKANPSDKVWVNDYVQDAMKNSTYLDELAATARSVGAVYYLGFKVSSALLNAFQNYTVGQAELSLMMKKAGHKGSGIAALAKAQKDVMADFINIKGGGTGTLTKEEHDVLFRAVREGTAQAQAIRQISGTQEMGFGTGWKKFTELSMTPFQFVEQRLNREPAILAAYRIFKKSAAGTIDEAAYKQAETFVNNTHYVMGKENLPEMVRKLGPLGKTAYLFQGYVHNYMHWMFNRAKDGEFATIARSLGAIAALGGVFALPGADDMDNWIMKWFGVSYKMKFKKFVKDAAGNSTPGQIVQNFVNHGVTSVAGVDMSRALAVNIPFISDPEKTFGERIGGAWGGLLKKPGMALNAANKGDYVRAVENLLPEFAANPMRAARQYNQGATTLGGKPVFDETGHQVKYTGTDVAKKVFGFNPMTISDRTNMKSDERDLNAYWKSERDDALAGIRRAKNSEDMKAAVRGVVKYNTELRKSQAFGLVPIIKADSIQRSRTFKPQKKTMAWERNQIE